MTINWKHNLTTLMDFVEDYTRQWAKREKEDLYTLSEWVKSVRSLIQIIIKKLSGFMSTGENLSWRGAVYNLKVTSYNVASRIIYEWGTCTGAIRRHRIEIVNIEIMQHVFVINC
jgi:hypothetical protein